MVALPPSVAQFDDDDAGAASVENLGAGAANCFHLRWDDDEEGERGAGGEGAG